MFVITYKLFLLSENVNRKWFPYAPKQFDTNPEIDFSNVPKELHDSVHGIQMGVLSDKCDNGKVNFYDVKKLYDLNILYD